MSRTLETLLKHSTSDWAGQGSIDLPFNVYAACVEIDAEIKALQAENERLRNVGISVMKDAERYRWLRQYARPNVLRGLLIGAKSAEDIDAAIDAAREGE